MNSKYSLIDLDKAFKIVMKCDMLNCSCTSEIVHMVNVNLNKQVAEMMQSGQIQDRGALSHMSTKIGVRPETILGCTIMYEMATMFIVDGQDKLVDSIRMLSSDRENKEKIKKYSKLAVLGGDYCGVCLKITVTMVMNGKKIEEKLFMRKMLKYKEKNDTLETLEEVREKVEGGMLGIFSALAEDNKRKSENDFRLKQSLLDLMRKNKRAWELNGFDNLKISSFNRE